MRKSLSVQFQFKSFVEHVAGGYGEKSTVDAKKQQATGDAKVRHFIFFVRIRFFDRFILTIQDATVDKWIDEFSTQLSNENEWPTDWATDAANLSSLDE